jgi:alcohol dehydrogenase class IV
VVVSNAGEPGDGRGVDHLAAQFDSAGIPWSFWRQRGEPHVGHVEQAVALARRDACDFVIGLGGGSAIDTAKAVAGLLTNGGGPLDYMEVIGKGQKLTRPAAPWLAIPTTAGTGAEATRNAVIGCAEKKFKASLRSPYLLASAALIDPQLAVDVPRHVTACSGMDALCQLIESYTSNQAQPICDALALEGIARAAQALPRVYENGQDLTAREDMALAAYLSGVTLANAGLGAVHGFAAPLGANLPIPHGAICAALLPHVMAANVESLLAASPEHPTLCRYAAIGKALVGRDDLPDTVAIEAGVQHVAESVERLGIPRLRPLGLTPERVPELVQLARKASSMRYNPVVLSDEALAAILHQAM